jgi:hypothetical protein
MQFLILNTYTIYLYTIYVLYIFIIYVHKYAQKYDLIVNNNKLIETRWIVF